MANLHVRDVDETLVRKLHQRAKANGRSVAEEHRQILRAALLGGSGADWFDLLAQLHKRIGKRPQTPSEELIREDRDR